MPDSDSERSAPSWTPGRRTFLGLMGATVLAACAGDDGGGDGTSPTTARALVDLPADPFTLGVASGDPRPESVILWTRLVPEGEPLGDEGVPVAWELGTDEALGDVVASGTVLATVGLGHSIHVEAGDLDPDTTYWYRFEVGNFESPVGRTRTLPPTDSSPDRLRFATASCAEYQQGFFTPYPHLADEDVDLVLFLGDYIYEEPSLGLPDDVRAHEGGEPMTVPEYRARYEQYKVDSGLQAAHAAAPWIVTFDDHEVENNWAGDVPEVSAAGEVVTTREEFLARRAAAFQAFYEHMPLRLGPPDGADLETYHALRWGDLADFFVLDTRQFRTDQVCAQPFDFGPVCADADDPANTMLGPDQKAWLTEELGSASGRWTFIAQQVPFAPVPFEFGGQVIGQLDTWEGYTAERDEVTALLADVSNPVVLTGDLHAAVVADVATEYGDDGTSGDVVATEFVATSVSSIFGGGIDVAYEQGADGLEWVQHADTAERGYTIIEVTADQLTADYRAVETTLEPESDIATAHSWTVVDGSPGARPA